MMAEYIERESLLEQMEGFCKANCGCKNSENERQSILCASCGMNDAIIFVEDRVAADVRPVVQGKWEKSAKYKGFVCCSECHNCYVVSEWITDLKWNYCPSCGCSMEVDI